VFYLVCTFSSIVLAKKHKLYAREKLSTLELSFKIIHTAVLLKL